MKKRLKIPKYSAGGQVALELAPLATSLISGAVGNQAVPTDGANMLKYGSQGTQMGLTLGSNPALMAATGGLSAPIGAAVGAIGGAGYGLYNANKLQKADRQLKAEESYDKKLADTYGAQNMDIYQAPVYAKGGKIKKGNKLLLKKKYAEGGTVNAPMIEVEKGELVVDENNLTHVGKVPHSEGGDKLPVYPKGFKRKDKPYAIAGGMVYSTQYNDEEREEIAKNVKKAKFPISTGAKNRAEKVLDYMGKLEGNSEQMFYMGGNIPKYFGGGGVKQSPLNTADARSRNMDKLLIYTDDNKYKGGPAYGGGFPGMNAAALDNIGYDNMLLTDATGKGTQTTSTQPKGQVVEQRTQTTGNPIPTSEQQSGMFGEGDAGGNTAGQSVTTDLNGKPLNTAAPGNQLVDDGTGYSGYGVGNLSKYLVPAYNMFMGARKPEYATMENYAPTLMTNPEAALLPNRLRDSRSAYSTFKNNFRGNMTAGQRNAMMLAANRDFNKTNQDIYGNFAKSEIDTRNMNNELINKANMANMQSRYLNEENRLKAISAGRNMMGEGLSQFGEIGQLDERNVNQMAVDELRTLLYSGSVPPNSKAAQMIEERLNRMQSPSKRRTKSK